jgi:hypothetical protein
MNALFFSLALMAPQAQADREEFVGTPALLPRLTDNGVGPDLCRPVTVGQPIEIGGVVLHLDERGNLQVDGPAVLLRNLKKGAQAFEAQPAGAVDAALRLQRSQLKRGVTLQLTQDDKQVAIHVQRDWRGVMWCPASGWRFELEATQVTYLDSNLTGRLDREDPVLYGGHLLATPWHPWLFDGDTILLDLRISPPATLSGARGDLPNAGPQQAEVATWNAFRLEHGVPPAMFAADRVEACEKHARYIGLHGGGHGEDPSKAGYSEEGRAAGSSSCITYGGRDGAVQRFLASLYHRGPMIGPSAFRLQIGGVGSTWLLGNIEYRRVGLRGQGGAVVQRFPAPGASFPVGTYAKENPRHPAFDEAGVLGLPVTLTFVVGGVPEVKSATLRRVRSRLATGKVGKEVACHLSYPHHNAPAGYEHLFQNVVLTPLSVLKRGGYEADFRFASGAIYRWRFRVGR